MLPLSFILPEARRKGIVINLAAMRLFYFKKEGNRLAVSTFPIGIGTAERPHPHGPYVYHAQKIAGRLGMCPHQLPQTTAKRAIHCQPRYRRGL